MKISLANENENEINFTIVAIKRKINAALRCSKAPLPTTFLPLISYTENKNIVL